MPAIVDVAPQGDLVVAIGKGHAQRNARISSTIIKIASPVFRAMLGPSFKEGQTTFNAFNPLRLPGDDPTSTLNLFQILHYNTDLADATTEDWLQKLVIVCDKYQCAPKLKDYINLKIYEMGSFNDVDSMIVAGLIGDERYFRRYSEYVVRTTRENVEASGHPELLKLVPADMLDRMQEYRLNARLEYRNKTLDLLACIYCSDYTRDHTLCRRLQKQSNALHEFLFQEGVLTKNVANDRYLPDMRKILFVNQPGFGAGIDRYSCHSQCGACMVSVDHIMVDTGHSVSLGTSEDCQVCLNCFQQGVFSFVYECETHYQKVIE